MHKNTKGHIFNTELKKWWRSPGNGYAENLSEAHLYEYSWFEERAKNYISNEFHPLSLFEIGKKYKTTIGRVALVTEIDPDDTEPLCIGAAFYSEEDEDWTDSDWYTAEGLHWANREENTYYGNLIPGSIEDEKPLFEVGKSYLDEGGIVCTILSHDSKLKNYDMVVQRKTFGIQAHYVADGSYWSDRKYTDKNLVPGAIEDKEQVNCDMQRKYDELLAVVEAARVFAEEQLNETTENDFEEGYDAALGNMLAKLGFTIVTSSTKKVVKS